MADATSFNLAEGEKAERKYLVTAINVGTSAAKVFEIVGVGVEDSTIDYNPTSTTLTDILGTTTTTLEKLETSQTLDPMSVRGGSALALKLYNQIKYHRLSEFALYEVLQIHAYVGTAGAYEAELHTGCTVIPTSLGGSASLDMPIDIQYSNVKTHGTVNDFVYGSTITFTPAS